MDNFLRPANHTAAKRAVNLIRSSVTELAGHPEIGAPMNDDTPRRELVIRFGKGAYIVRYIPDIDAGVIRVLRIWHSREKR